MDNLTTPQQDKLAQLRLERALLSDILDLHLQVATLESAIETAANKIASGKPLEALEILREELRQ